MTWSLDPSSTTIEFSVRHMMIHTVRGTFTDVETELDIDESDLTKSQVTARIAARSVKTGDRLRDEYLVSGNFFNPTQYPHLEFRSTSARIQGKKISVSGRLKIRDRQQQLILKGTCVGPKSGLAGGPRKLTFDLSAELDREAYDLVFHGAVETVSIVVSKKVNISLHIVLSEDAS